MRKLKTEKGITLIALIITIIVMLILVGVSVTVALNGGLFSTAKTAAEETKTARDEELQMTEEGYIEAVANRMEVGTEVTIGETGENFYVIKDEGAKLVLLAKNNINTTSLKQANGDDITANTVAFASGDTSYWSTYTGTYPLNLNEYGACPEGSAIDIAKQYAEEITGSRDNGRLMTLEEVEALGGSRDSHSTEDCNTNGNGFVNLVDGAILNYWMGSAFDTDFVWLVGGFGRDLTGRVFGTFSYFGVRPVIEISESNVTKVP